MFLACNSLKLQLNSSQANSAFEAAGFLYTILCIRHVLLRRVDMRNVVSNKTRLEHCLLCEENEMDTNKNRKILHYSSGVFVVEEGVLIQ